MLRSTQHPLHNDPSLGLGPNSRPRSTAARKQLGTKGHLKSASYAGIVSFLGLSFLAGAESPPGPGAEASASSSPGLLNLSLEELASVKITSVSKREQKLSEAGAAISVVSGDEVRRQGTLRLTDALRYVPGVHVGNVNSSSVAVSVRGFNDAFANKLLVLLDGRSVYNPMFSGVIWESQDLLLEDLDRIEVIRGPGATLWGANAVNGVINVLTKPAKETQGLLVTGGGGLEENGFGAVRYGATFNEQTHMRVYAKHFDKDASSKPNGDSVHDSWNRSQGGFRLDWEPSQASTFSLQGDLHHALASETYSELMLAAPYSRIVEGQDRHLGGNLMGKWNRKFSDKSQLSTQVYYDRTDSTLFGTREVRDTVDWDLQHELEIGERNTLVAGGGYRYTNNRLYQTPDYRFRHDSRGAQLLNLFVQDEFSILPDHLRLTFGSKFEHNDFTGVEIQPSLRITWLPNQRNTLWTSVSRAVRSPAQFEIDAQINRAVIPAGQNLGAYVNPVLPTIVRLHGSDSFKSEELMAYELGYRLQVSEPVSLDLSVFYNEYDRIRSNEFDFTQITTEGSPFPNRAVLPMFMRNGFWGETYGAELSVCWQPSESWKWVASYEFLQMQLHKEAATLDFQTEKTERNTPHHQVKLRSAVDLSRTVELDLGLRYVDSVGADFASSYVVGDARLGWRPSPHWEFSIVAQNLFERRHREYVSALGPLNQGLTETAVFGKVTMRF